jgi:hypothetical protein
MRQILTLALLLGTLPALALSGDWKNNKDGTVALPDGPAWMRCTLGEEGEGCEEGMSDNHTWSSADEACKAADLAGRTWRLPTQEELLSLVVESQPTIYQDVFPNTAVDGYWTSTPEGTRSHMVVSFLDGKASSQFDSKRFWVRCISD